jgi:hypothetical protein
VYLYCPTGRYNGFAAYPAVLRYDTRLPLSNRDAWIVFDLRRTSVPYDFYTWKLDFKYPYLYVPPLRKSVIKYATAGAVLFFFQSLTFPAVDCLRTTICDTILGLRSLMKHHGLYSMLRALEVWIQVEWQDRYWSTPALKSSLRRLHSIILSSSTPSTIQLVLIHLLLPFLIAAMQPGWRPAASPSPRTHLYALTFLISLFRNAVLT